MMQIPFSPPDIDEQDIQSVVEALRSGWITTGPKTKELERQLAAYCQADRAACLNSATAALELALRVLGIGPGDEVITSAYTYTASASVICHVGATPVLVDTDPGSFHLSPEKMRAAITSRTKAVIPVDIGGVPCDYRAIFKALEREQDRFVPQTPLQAAIGRIAVVADAAHAIGATYGGQMVGSVADFTCFSFHAVKNLTTAEGGCAAWRRFEGVDSDEIYRQFMLLSLHGQTKDALSKTRAGSWEYDIVSPAYKCNMTDIMAALGLSQLARYPALLARRRQLIEQYDRAFAGQLESLRHYGDDYTSSGHLYLARVPGAGRIQRDALIERIGQQGVATNVHYKPLPLLTAYKDMGYSIADYPCALAQFENEITLPVYTTMTDAQQQYVIEVVKNCLEDLRP
ncbi:DegT/DnrJ/EryC1/StrS family aminotransferase [Neobittarella massiliensis]|uniref:DegT/DnrJ/EryC1/StrS family aminotransferase n=1 Tax=Neobittarella massiliensis (ex Bilen et al. 2018) TaxID=2041842 RepID=UPI003520F872